jgi:outer membrane protein TolC
MKKILSLALLVLVFSFNLVAGEPITLSKAKETVVNSNVNLSIAYENYVMIQNEARSKSLQLLPSLNMDLLIYNYQYTILRSVIPEPQRFFEASAEKDLAKAAGVNRLIVKKNLLEDLEKSFYLYQFHKEMVSSFNKELEIRSQIALRSKTAYDLGTIDFDEYYRSQREVITARTQAVNGNELLQTEGYALKLILQVNDNDEELNLVPAPFYNVNLDFPASSSEAAKIAANNSKEVEQFNCMIDAANKQKKGVTVSWISWSGVGFDYFARVSIAKAGVEKLELQKAKAAIEVKNQVALAYDEIAKHQEKMAFQDQLLKMAKIDLERVSSIDNEEMSTFIARKTAELTLMSAERETRKLQYELELKFIKLKRLLGTNMSTNAIPRA